MCSRLHFFGLIRSRLSRQSHTEAGPTGWTIVRLDSAVMCFDNRLHNKKPEPCSFMALCELSAVKLFKQVRPFVWGDAAAGVLHFNNKMLSGLPDGHPNMSTGWSELECVLNEIRKDPF